MACDVCLCNLESLRFDDKAHARGGGSNRRHGSGSMRSVGGQSEMGHGTEVTKRYVGVGARRASLLNGVSTTALRAVATTLALGVTLSSSEATGFSWCMAGNYAAGEAGHGVLLCHGGTVTNPFGSTISGSLGSVYIDGGPGNVTNAGSLVDGVWLQAGGDLVNQAGGTIDTSPSGYGIGMRGPGSVTNAGAISGYIMGIGLDNGGTVTNQPGGTISGGLAGVLLGVDPTPPATTGGGTVTNNAGGTITGYSGIFTRGAAATVINAGAITGTTAKTVTGVSGDGYPFSLVLGDGVSLGGGGTVTNQTGGTITGARYGVYVTGGAGTVTNYGTISGVSAGVSISGGRAAVTNSGTITATATAKYGEGVGLQTGTVTNSGTITRVVWP